MPIVTGTAGNQDVMRQAALKYAGSVGNAGGAAPSPGGVPQPMAQSSVADHLAQAVQLTLSTPDKGAAIAAWKQAFLTLQAQMSPEGAQAPPPGPNTAPNGMQSMGAQAVSPIIGRAPR